MREWLAICSAVPLAAATPAYAQMRTLLPAQAPSLPHEANFGVSDQSWTNDPAPLADGMITTEGTAPNSMVGVGLVKMHGRKRNGSDLRPGNDSDFETRNPAVTFVLKF